MRANNIGQFFDEKWGNYVYVLSRTQFQANNNKIKVKFEFANNDFKIMFILNWIRPFAAGCLINFIHFMLKV